MNRTLTLASREIKASLSSPLAYVFTILFVAVSFLVFFLVEIFFGNDQATARGFFRWMPPLLGLVAPALTMRLWADEKKMGTYEILTTLPLAPYQLVLGKFLASFALLSGALVFTLGIPFVAEAYGDLDWGPVFGGYVGAVLLGSAYLAIGLLCSMVAQDQILALFMGWAICALSILPDTSFWKNIVGESLKSAGFWSRFRDIERGVLDFNNLAFYVSVTAWFLFMNVVLLRWRRFTS